MSSTNCDRFSAFCQFLYLISLKFGCFDLVSGYQAKVIVDILSLFFTSLGVLSVLYL